MKFVLELRGGRHDGFITELEIAPGDSIEVRDRSTGPDSTVPALQLEWSDDGELLHLTALVKS